MNPDSTDTANSTAKPKFRFVRWIFRLTLIGLTLTLMAALYIQSPSGQRWLIRQVLQWTASHLDAEGRQFHVEIGHADIGLFPPALELEEVVLVAEDDARSDSILLGLGHVALSPHGLSGTRWSSIKLHQIQISEEGAQWLSTMANGDKGTSDLSFWIEHLLIEDVLLHLPDSTVSADLEWVSIDRLSLENGTYGGGKADWSEFEATVLMGSRNPRNTQIDTTTLNFSGDLDTLDLTFDSKPEFWLETDEGQAAFFDMIPHRWQATVMAQDSTLLLHGQSEWGRINGAIGLDSLGLRLDSVELHLPEGLPVRTDWMKAASDISLTGPVYFRLDEGRAGSSWSERLTGALGIALHSTSREITARLNLDWDLQSGALETAGSLLATSPAPLASTSVEVDLSGTLFPVSQLESWPILPAVSLSGLWAMDVPGEHAGCGKSNGQLSLQGSAGNTETALPRIGVSGDAWTSPVRLSESLELHGGWTFQGECTFSQDYGLSDWWAHVDLTQGRLIPLSGFSGKTSRGAPMAFKRMSLQSRGDDKRFNLELNSDYAKLEAEGPFSAEAWTVPIKEILKSGGLLIEDTPSAVAAPTSESAKAGNWSVDLKLWNDDLLDRYSGNAWSLGSGSSISANHRDGHVTLDAILKNMHFGAWKLKGLRAVAQGGLSPLTADLQANQFSHPSLGNLQQIAVAGEVDLGGVSHIRAHWDGQISGDVSVDHALEGKSQHMLTPQFMEFQFEDMSWEMASRNDSWLSWHEDDWASLRANDIVLSSSEGIIGLYQPDSSVLENVGLELRMERFPAGPWMGLASRLGGITVPEADGALHGWIGLDMKNQHALGEIQWEDAQVENIRLGDLCFEGAWHGEWIGRFQQFLTDKEVLTAEFDGLDQARLSMNHWPLRSINPILQPFGISAEGFLDGACEVNLSPAQGPAEILGTIQLQAQTLDIAATGMSYAMEGQVDFAPSHIGMDLGRVTDPLGNAATVNASLQHVGFADWNWDFGLELIEPIQVMDLPADPGRLYHGQVFAIGEANVSGSSGRMEVEANATTAAGTRFTMPLDALEGPGLPPGIQFTGPRTDLAGSSAVSEDAPLDFSLSIGINVTREAELSMVLDQRAGERVDGQAEGKLTFTRSNSSALNMQGGLDIVSGAYRFSFRDFLTKTISVQPGSRIDWDGNPYDAELAINALKRMKANPNPLIPQMINRGKTDVEVIMGIHGPLSAPQLTFTVDFPAYKSNDSAMLSKVQAILSTQEENQRQAFALLAMDQFVSPQQEGVQTLGRVVTAQASELISTGVSELISSLSKDLDIGVRYVPSNAGANDVDPNSSSNLQDFRSEDALEMDLGVSLLDNRLNISGTLGATGVDGFSTQEPDFRGGIDIRYQLTSDGRWELVGYSKPESELDEESRYGIGARYQVRFNRLADLFLRKDP